MSWNASNTTDQKRKFIDTVEANNKEDSFTSICNVFDISRDCGYRLLRRYREVGDKAFEPQCRRPRHSPQAIKPAVEQ